MDVLATGLAKRFRSVTAVNDVSFSLQPGVVTGFLGPNGAGKSTTMRLMLGLDRGEGSTLFGGKPLVAHRHATRVVGAHLDARFFHPKRTARNHLRMLAADAGVSNARVDEVLELVGLAEVGRKRPRTFSLGMGQRLGLAGAILAEPEVLILDEPANGLDPQSIQWLREFLRWYAQAGRVVLVSSHLLSEMQLLADHVLVITQGTLIADEPMAEFIARSTRNDVFVRSTNNSVLSAALSASGLSVREESGGLAVQGATTDRVGQLAFATGVVTLELTMRTASLEEAFLEMTSGGQQFQMSSHGPLAHQTHSDHTTGDEVSA